MAIAYSIHLELCNKNKAIGSSGNQQQTKGKLAANTAQRSSSSSSRRRRRRFAASAVAVPHWFGLLNKLLLLAPLLPRPFIHSNHPKKKSWLSPAASVTASACCWQFSLLWFLALSFGRVRARKLGKYCFAFILCPTPSLILSLSRCVSSALVFIYFLNGVRISRFQFQCRIKVASLDAVGRGVSGWQRERARQILWAWLPMLCHALIDKLHKQEY